MANDKANEALDNKGQQKTHEVFDADGNPMTMTQEEWRNRDKSVGYTRPEDEFVEDAPDEEVSEASTNDG